MFQNRRRRVKHVDGHLSRKRKRRVCHVTRIIIRATVLECITFQNRKVLSTHFYKMSNKNICAKRKRPNSPDSACLDFVLPARNRRRIIASDSEEEDSVNPEADFVSEEWIWEDKENECKVWQYSRVPGLNIEIGERTTALEMVNQIFSKDFWDLIVTEINRYARPTMGDATRKVKQPEEFWRDTNVNEIQAYFALCILMSEVKKSNVQSYWSRRNVIQTPIFQETMPWQRFAQLSRFLNFLNTEVKEKSDSLIKLQGLIDNLNERFGSIYIPEEDVLLDESLMKCTGPMLYKKFDSKRTRFGIYRLCESKSGYCLKFRICDEMDSATSAMLMCTQIANVGHTLYMNNSDSSPELFQKLRSMKINAIGTVKHNSKNFPKDLAITKLKKSEAISRSCKGILAAKWKDKKEVYLLSTKHEKVEMVKVQKSLENSATVTKPDIVLEYNESMAGVDHQDSCLTSFSVMRNHTKGYKKLFFYLMDIALFNAYALFLKTSNTLKCSDYTFSNFRLDVAEQILESVRLPEFTDCGGLSADDPPLRLKSKQWGHFPRNIPPTQAKKNPQRRCKVCAKHKKRSETVWECKKCLVALHIPDCFELYHTELNY